MSSKIGSDIHQAAALLRSGELVAIPTETVYGLAANAFNTEGVAKIYEAKNRPQFNPLIIHTDSIEKLKSWGLSLPPKAKLLTQSYAPGPITFLIHKSAQIPDIITAGTNAVAVRIPDHPLTLKLLAMLDFPLAAPSANPSGFVSPTRAQHVDNQLGDKVAYILDGGSCTVGVESTIVSFLDENKPKLLRYGGLALEDIERVIGVVALPQQGYSDNPVAPGMLARHYATRHPMIIGDPEASFNDYDLNKVAVISFNKKYPQIPENQQFILSEKRSLTEAATKLFAAMRQANDMDVTVILSEVFPNEGLGRAINDRLRRAATV